MIGSKEILGEIRHIREEAIDGQIEMSKAYYELYLIQKEAKSAIDSIKEDAILDVEKHGKNGFEIEGNRLTTGAKTTWYYDHIPEWVELKEKLKSLENTFKIAYDVGETVDEETGEVLMAAIKRKSEFVKVEKIKNK